jgi:signal transduction histidine kinase
VQPLSGHDSGTHHVRRLNRIFLVLSLLTLAISGVAVFAQWTTVSSKRRLVDAYENLAREAEHVRMLSERRARKLRTSMLLARPSHEADFRRTRDALRDKVDALGTRMALQSTVGAVLDAGSALAVAEDRLLVSLRSGAGRPELSQQMTEEVLPLREDFDEAILGLTQTVERLLGSARADSQRTDAIAIGALSMTVALALIAIVALLARLRSVLRDLRSTRARLEEMTAFQQYLMGMVGHDIRSPLNAILLAATMIPDSGDQVGLETARARIIRNGTRIERMAGLLMDVTRMQAGLGIPISPRRADLHEVVGHVVEEVRSTTRRAIEHHQAGDGRGDLDDDRVVQVVTNLVNNAVTYSPPRSPVAVVSSGTETELAIEVHNEGDIAADVLPRIFEPFRRGDATRGSKFNAGLGLYVVRQLTEAMHGRIDVRSTEQEGTTFRVILPRHQASEIR